jgi:hypothetical protein
MHHHSTKEAEPRPCSKMEGQRDNARQQEFQEKLRSEIQHQLDSALLNSPAPRKAIN